MSALRLFAWRCAQLIAILAGIAIGTALQRAPGAQTIGLHLATAHSSTSYYTRHPLIDRDTLEQIGMIDRSHRFESFNPGVYVRWDSGATAGAFRNSYGRTSAYAGWTWETGDRLLALTLGAVTGYPGAALAPLVAPSMRISLPDRYAARLTLLPKPPTARGSAGLHFSIERSF